MSVATKQGVLVSIEDYAVMDYFVDAPVVNCTLQANGKLFEARIKMGTDFRPAIGDEIEINWDYSRFWGRIVTVKADGERVLIPETLPIEGDRAFNLTDILDSLK